MLVYTIIFLPILCSLLCFIIEKHGKAISSVALSIQLLIISFLVIQKLLNNFIYPVEHLADISHSIYYLQTLDGLSLMFIWLSSMLTLICVIWTEKSMENRFFVLFTILNVILIIFFSTRNLLLFYIMFEISLIPLFFMIGIWGSETRFYASFKFIIYTMAGSISFLVTSLYLYNKFGIFDIIALKQQLTTVDIEQQKLLWIAFFISLAVKIPMFPFHSWLTVAHVQAPTQGSVMLAGILIKVGGYGMIRILIEMLPEPSQYFSTMILWLSVISILYASIIAFGQKDMKKMIAYSSIAHMGIVTAGIFSFTSEGLNGAIFQMFSHGLVSSALFLSIGILYSRTHTKEISAYSNLANIAPKFSIFFIIFTMASIGLPGTSGFIGEFITISGIFKTSILHAFLALMSVILSATYMLVLCKNIIWNPSKSICENSMNNNDITTTEMLILSSLAILILANGIFPSSTLTISSTTVNKILSIPKQFFLG